MSTLVKKLKIKNGDKILILNSPEEYLSQIKDSFEGVEIVTTAEGKHSFIQLFVKNLDDLKEKVSIVMDLMEKEAILWISYPKQTSHLKSDINRDSCWNTMYLYKLKGVTQVSINRTWSAIRFKHIDTENKKSKSKPNIDSKYVDFENRIVVPPEDILEAINQNITAKGRFEKMAFTHKKEYIVWILQAKRPETRKNRIQKMISRLGKE